MGTLKETLGIINKRINELEDLQFELNEFNEQDDDLWCRYEDEKEDLNIAFTLINNWS